VARQCQGQLRRAGMAGVVVGLDLPAAMQIGAALGYDAGPLVHLLTMIETPMVEAINRREKDAARE